MSPSLKVIQILKGSAINELERTLLNVVQHIVVSQPQLLPSIERIVFLARRRGEWNKILKEEVPIEERFTKIYKENMWNGNESRSGFGSGLAYTENLRAKLPPLIAKYQVKSVFDAPCGDLHWMRYLLPTLTIDYVGGDIVKELIEENRKNFSNARTQFMHMNLLEDPFPAVDLMLCRDCLFHFSYGDIRKMLRNFVASNIPYLLTTTHVTGEKNRDIVTGAFRQINLFDYPFHFDANPLERIDDWMKPEPERQMCLWSRTEVERALLRLETNMASGEDFNRGT